MSQLSGSQLVVLTEMELPKTATQFVAFMEEVWNVEFCPDKNGAVILYGTQLYADYKDAIHTARRCGMARTGGAKLGGIDCDVYRFPNAADGVLIAKNGSAVSYIHPGASAREEHVAH